MKRKKEKPPLVEVTWGDAWTCESYNAESGDWLHTQSVGYLVEHTKHVIRIAQSLPFDHGAENPPTEPYDILSIPAKMIKRVRRI